MGFRERYLYLAEEDQATSPQSNGPMKLDTTLSGDSYVSAPQQEQKQTSENIGKPLVQNDSKNLDASAVNDGMQSNLFARRINANPTTNDLLSLTSASKQLTSLNK